MKRTSFSFKRDKYKSSRGGHSRLLNVSCRKCEKLLLVYQKDGSGNLRRLYMDRILHPTKFIDLQNISLKSIPKLTCGHCREVLGTPYLYQRRNEKLLDCTKIQLLKGLEN